MKIKKSQLKALIKEEISKIKKESKLLKESGFLNQTESLIKRYLTRQDLETANNLKQAANDMLDAYHSGGVEAVNALDRTQYDPAIHQMFNWLRGHLRGDVSPKLNYTRKDRRPIDLPQNVEAEYERAREAAEASLQAWTRSQEREKEARAREEARRAALSPEERAREDNKRETWAMYGGDPSKRPWGLGT